MSGRPARKKKLVRTKRLSDSDSSDNTSSVDGGGGATPNITGSATPTLATWRPRESGMAEALNPKWRRAAVRAVELQAGSITAWPRHRTEDLASRPVGCQIRPCPHGLSDLTRISPCV